MLESKLAIDAAAKALTFAAGHQFMLFVVSLDVVRHFMTAPTSSREQVSTKPGH
jgi:hypothetical protein